MLRLTAWTGLGRSVRVKSKPVQRRTRGDGYHDFGAMITCEGSSHHGEMGCKICRCNCPTCVAARSDRRLCLQVRNFTSSFPLLSGNHQRLPLPQARPKYPFTRVCSSTRFRADASVHLLGGFVLLVLLHTHTQSIRKRPIIWSCVSRKEVR
jgi:hypothetical protein